MTMHEAAKLIGVSPMTVSRVLSGESKNVKQETRERVLAEIKRIGYAPNAAARSLAAARTLRIGLLYNNPSAAYLNEFLVGILDESGRSDCQITLENCSTHNERAAVRKLLSDGLDGILLPPPLSDSKQVLESLRSAEIPFVCVAGSTAAGLSVCIDNFAAAKAMTSHLLTLGHRDIAFILGAPNQLASAQRHAGFVAALDGIGVKLRPTRIKQGNFTYRSGLTAANELLNVADRPTAIFASNDDMAAAAIATAHRLHLEVPGDLTVVGFDDTLLATTIWPPLTTIRQPIAMMAKKALELLIKEIRLRSSGETLQPLQQLLKFALVKRDSSAPK
jgi:LacI family transcriptional regulator, galactose operon repressor